MDGEGFGPSQIRRDDSRIFLVRTFPTVHFVKIPTRRNRLKLFRQIGSPLSDEILPALSVGHRPDVVHGLPRTNCDDVVIWRPFGWKIPAAIGIPISALADAALVFVPRATRRLML